MLTFSSEIHVKPECDRVSVLSLLNDWFLASQLSSKWLSKKQCSPFDIYKNEPIEKEEENILLTKTYGNFYYIYTNLGNIYKIVKNNTSIVNKINIIKNISNLLINN